MTQQLPIPPALGTLYARSLPDSAKRQHHHLAHELLCDTLPDYARSRGIAVTELPPRLLFAEHGKPSLAVHPEICFNLSHCDGLAICLYSAYECGADCESIRSYKPRTAQRVCSPQELAALECAENRDFLFTRLWTLKEAYVKALGIGISYPLREVSFTLTDDGIVCSKPDAAFSQLLLERHIVSVCVLGQPPELRPYNGIYAPVV